MKVLHLNTIDVGGAAIGSIRQHYALKDAGIDSRILFMRNINAHVKGSYYYLGKISYYYYRLLQKSGLISSNYEKEMARILKIGKPFEYGGKYELFSPPYSNFSKLQDNKHVQWADIINLHWVSGFVDYQSFFSNLQKPIVWTLHDMNPYLGGYHYSIDSIKNNDLNGIESEYKLIKQNCVRVDAVIGNSNWNTNEAIKSLVFNHTRIFKTIYYSLPLDSYYPIDKELAKKSLGIENSTIVIGFACEKVWSPRKGFNILLEAINNLNAETKSKILCVAFGKKADNIEDLVPNVRIMQIGSADSSEKQRLLYSAMNVFVIPSLAEAFGLSALEALACGTPIIGSDTGGIPEMIDDGKNGYLFKCGDSIDLSNKIMTFILQEQNWVQMSQNAVNSVALKHLPSFQAREYLQVYNEVLSKNK